MSDANVREGLELILKELRDNRAAVAVLQASVNRLEEAVIERARTDDRRLSSLELDVSTTRAREKRLSERVAMLEGAE